MVTYIFRLTLAWYIIGILLEVIFPGFVSNYISLDWFLWCVILLALTSFIIQRKQA